MLVPTFHLFVLVLDSYTLWYQDRVNFQLPPEAENYRDLPFKLRFLFLTIWCLVLQTLYFGLAILNDAFGTNEVSPKKTPLLRTLKDIIFSLAFPLSFYVCIAFWTIYTLDKDLIFPEHIEKVLPFWCNHVMHTLIVPFVVLELILTPKKYPNKKVGITFSMFFIFCYLTLLGIVYMKSGTMIYPALDAMNCSVKISFISVSIVVGIIVYFLGETLNNLIHGVSRAQELNKIQKTKRK